MISVVGMRSRPIRKNRADPTAATFPTRIPTSVLVAPMAANVGIAQRIQDDPSFRSKLKFSPLLPAPPSSTTIRHTSTAVQ